MCGRFALYSDPFTLAKQFKAEALPELRPRYNVAPSQNIPIVREEGEKRRFALARWGLIPHWAKDAKIGYKMINARAETVAEKPAFRNAFKHRRCLIPADGYYEWQAIAGTKTKQPWFMVLKDREPMAFAGLWEQWRSPEGEELESCSIIVTEANEIMRPIHDRMPVILAPGDWDAWLEPDAQDTQALQALLKPYPAEGMAAWPVSTKVNSPRNDLVECVEALG
ncbi:MAG: SOS response-associated peptidase [Dehalococcoidia bacterium]|nr:SOS response-associated peptidase [Dehalococcoidia bacterium]